MIENLPDAFARHQVVLSDHGTPVDFIFLDLNNTFEEMVGHKREALIGKRLSEAHPRVIESAYGWIGDFSRLSKDFDSESFEYYSKAEIRAEFENCKSTHFDPTLTALFLSILDSEGEMVSL